jgi:hypothetical protein
MNKYLINIFVLSIILSIIELNTNKNFKNNSKRFPLILTVIIHYIIYFFIYLTIFYVLMPNYFPSWYILMYIIFLILVLASWLLFDNKCIITILTNKFVNISESNAFRDPFDILSNSYVKINPLNESLSFRDKLYYFFVITSILISIFILLSKSIK